MKTKEISIKIDGKKIKAHLGETILDIAKRNNIFIPSLCYHPDLDVKANCRVCVVQIKGSKKLQTACSTFACDKMEVLTNSESVKLARKTNLELIFATHIEKCSTCTSRFDCEILRLAKKYDINIANYKDRKTKRKTYKFANAVEIDASQCIDCHSCISACSDLQNIHYLQKKDKGSSQEVCPVDDDKVDCIYCGQCTSHCPVASAQEQDNWSEVEDILNNKSNKVLVAFFAPSVRVSIGEYFGLPYGHNSSELLNTALKILGFDHVLDVNFAADLTTMVEAQELIERVNDKKSTLPMITSCCPAWVKYLEFYRPDLLAHLTTSRSPQIHLGGVVKTYWAKKMNINPKDIVTVSIMPCTAKKYESRRKELKIGSMYPVDQVLTVRELAFLIKKSNINFKNLPKTKGDTLSNSGSGAAVIYGASGGVMESALRTASKLLCDAKEGKKCLNRIDFKECRGFKDLKEASLDINGLKVNIAILNGIAQVDKLLDNLDKYHYIEVMACKGGCIGGGGQSIPSSREIVSKRMSALYKSDKKLKIREAHKNEEVLDVLDWLKENNLEHKILHTNYSKKTK